MITITTKDKSQNEVLRDL